MTDFPTLDGILDFSKEAVQREVDRLMAHLGRDGRGLPHGCELNFVPQRIVFWRNPKRRWNLLALALELREEKGSGLKKVSLIPHAVCFFKACPDCREYSGAIKNELPPPVPHERGTDEGTGD